MKKYLTVFQVAWQNEFTYRLNFVLWRFRNILRLLMTYFLWAGIFTTNQNVFGYSQGQMLTYVFMVLLVSTLVLSSPSSDNIGGEIANGDLSNYLLKPVSYLKYWFTRDLSSKLLNIIFAFVEVTILWFLLKPEVQFPSNLVTLLAFIFSCLMAIVLYFFVNVTARLVSFWTPENTWGIAFVVLVLQEILGGGIFPLDILPKIVSTILQFTPFPYLIYYPAAIFLGKFQGWELIRILGQMGLWILIMSWLCRLTWRRGLMAYASEGR